MRHRTLSSFLLFALLSPFAAAQTWTYQGSSSCFHYGSNVQCFENGTIQRYATSQEQFDAAFKTEQEDGQGIGMLVHAWMAHRRHLELERKDIRAQITEYTRGTCDLGDELSVYNKAVISALDRLARLDPPRSSIYLQQKASLEITESHTEQIRPNQEKWLPGIVAAKDIKFLQSSLDRTRKFYDFEIESSKKQFVFSEFFSAYADILESSQRAQRQEEQANQSPPVETELPNLRRLAESGNVDAQVTLAKMYRDGSGVTQNVVTAAKWFQSAASLGQSEAQLAIGELFEEGHGVAQDFVKAHMWYNLAAAAGVSGAETRRNAIGAKMTPEQLADAQRLASQWRLANENK